MAYLGISHLTIRQTYVLAAGIEMRKRIFSPQGVDKRLSLSVNGIRVVVASLAPTIQNH